DVFDLQDQVTANVVAAIAPHLRAAEIQRAQRKPAGGLHAYDLMLRAMPHYHARTPDSLTMAASILRKAIEIDPTYAPGLAYLASCRWIMVSQGWADPGDPALAEMLALAQAALSHGPSDPEVLLIVAGITARAGGDLYGGISLVDRSISLNPN